MGDRVEISNKHLFPVLHIPFPNKRQQVKQKISIILPIHNAEKELTPLVHDCFETVGDVKAECEIIIIDNASTDATAETAESLSLEFPQVKLVSQRHAMPGIEKSVLQGVQRADGDMLYIYYMLSGYVFPQISFYYEAMPFTDVVLGRFLGEEESFVGMAMYKRKAVNALADAIAYPDEAVAVMQAKDMRYLELRYEPSAGRRILISEEQKKKPSFLRKPQVVSAIR